MKPVDISTVKHRLAINQLLSQFNKHFTWSLFLSLSLSPSELTTSTMLLLSLFRQMHREIHCLFFSRFRANSDFSLSLFLRPSHQIVIIVTHQSFVFLITLNTRVSTFLLNPLEKFLPLAFSCVVFFASLSLSLRYYNSRRFFNILLATVTLATFFHLLSLSLLLTPYRRASSTHLFSSTSLFLPLFHLHLLFLFLMQLESIQASIHLMSLFFFSLVKVYSNESTSELIKENIIQKVNLTNEQSDALYQPLMILPPPLALFFFLFCSFLPLDSSLFFNAHSSLSLSLCHLKVLFFLR